MVFAIILHFEESGPKEATACNISFALNRVFSRNQSVKLHLGTFVTGSIGWNFRNDDGRHDVDVPKSLEGEIISMIENLENSSEFRIMKVVALFSNMSHLH